MRTVICTTIWPCGKIASMKWTPIATAPDQLVAEMWRDMLIQEGIPARIDATDAVSFLGVSSLPCRVLVPEDHAERGREVLSAHNIPVQ